MPETTIHLHWCPRCESTWDCEGSLSGCPVGGGEVIANHCDRPMPDDDESY
jgi:hypothetical protein